VSVETPAKDHDRWFGTDAVRANLRAHSVRSGAIALGGRGTLILMNLGGVMVLARVLRPEDFGVLAMILPLTILFNGIANMALQTALMHEEHLDHASVSAVFRRAALLNLLLAAIMAAGSPLLSRLYEDPRAASVGAVWAACLYLATLSAVHESLLKRQMRFGTIMSANIVGIVLGILAAIAAALAGARHWALLLQFVVMDLCRVVVVWRVCGWRPSLRPGANETAQAQTTAKRIFDYWRNLSGFRAVNWLADHPDRILVGHLGGAATLGLYDSARRWAFYPFTELFLSLSDVAVATFSRVAHDAAQYRAFVRRGVLPVLALPLPVIAFVAVEARSAVNILLGDQWLGAVPFVRLMCLAAFVGCLSRITQWLYLSRGETARQLRWAMYVQTPVMLTAVLIGTRFGAIGVAVGFTVGTCVLALPGLAWCLAGSPLTMGELLGIAARPALSSIVSGLFLFAVGPLLPDVGGAVLNLALRVVLFGGVYVSLWMVLPGGKRATAEVLEALRDLRGGAVGVAGNKRDSGGGR
jgi:PST family polysaccharide transporter